MKDIYWTEKEMLLINEIIGDRCIDINNDKNWDVSVKFYGRGHNNKIFAVGPDYINGDKLFYTVTENCRNFDGEIVDERGLEIVVRPRLTKYLKAMLNRIIFAYEHE